MARTVAPKRGKPEPKRPRRTRPPSRWRRFVAWLSRTHPVGRAVVGLVAPITAILTVLLAFGVFSHADAREQLAKSGAASIGAGSSAIHLGVATQVGDETIAFTAAGGFDYEARRGSLTYDFSRVEGLERAVGVEGRFIDGVAYLRLPRELLQRGDPPWVQVDLAGIDELLRDLGDAGVAPAATHELSVLADVSLTNPSGVLEELRRAGDVEKIGEENRFGVETSVYRGTLAIGERERLRATAWIDGDDLVRRLELGGGDASGSVRAEMTFGDYGTAVDVAVPQRRLLASELYGRLIAG